MHACLGRKDSSGQVVRTHSCSTAIQISFVLINYAVVIDSSEIRPRNCPAVADRDRWHNAGKNDFSRPLIHAAWVFVLLAVRVVMRVRISPASGAARAR